MEPIPERDWKKIRDMKDGVLARACDEFWEKLEVIGKKRGADSHGAYLEAWDLLHREDKKIALLFDGLKRSNALIKLAGWRRHGLITDDDLAPFSEKTRELLGYLLQINK